MSLLYPFEEIFWLPLEEIFWLVGVNVCFLHSRHKKMRLQKMWLNDGWSLSRVKNYTFEIKLFIFKKGACGLIRAKQTTLLELDLLRILLQNKYINK